MRGTGAAAAFVLAIAAGLPSVLHGAGGQAQETVSGPVLGVIFDPASERFLPIHGIAGSATEGRPIQAGVRVSRALVSPEGDHALAEIGEFPEVGLIRFGDGEATIVPLSGVPKTPELMALSPSGTAGALFYSAQGKIVVLTGLAQASPEVRDVAVPGGLGRPSALAVSDDGKAVLVAIPEGGEDALYAASGGFRALARFGRAAAVSFVANSRNALVADAAGNRIYRIGDEGEVIPIADERQGISGPVAVAATTNSARVVVLNSNPPGIVIVDTSSGESAAAPCRCSPRRLETLRGGESFLLSAEPDSPLWLLIAGPQAPQTLFVPAYRDELERTDDGRGRSPIGGGREKR